MKNTEKIESQLEIGFEMLKASLTNENGIPILTVFIKNNYDTKILFPAKHEKDSDFVTRLRALSKEFNPYMIVGCDPVNKPEYDGLIIAVHPESKVNRCFYHKRKFKPSEGWEETFDL